MFSIQARFLTRRYYGADFRDRSKAEWPPHPSRLYSALVSAVYHLDGGEPHLDALKWLEKQAPPAIRAGIANKRLACTHFVPVNHEVGSKKSGFDLMPGARNSRQPRFFPSLTPELESIVFVWANANPNDEVINALEEICSSVQSLGHSSSLCSLYPSFENAEVDYVPNSRGDLPIRVPYPGRLEELEFLYQKGFRPTPGKTVNYSHVSNKPAVFERNLSDFFIWRFGEGIIPLLSQSLHLCSSVRKALMSIGGDDAPGLIHGHAGDHISIVPLPYVGAQYSDGRLMGVAISLPHSINGIERRQILKILGSLESLNMGPAGTLGLERVKESSTMTLQESTWTKSSKTWATVTPLILPIYPKQKEGKRVKDIFIRLAKQAKLPLPKRIEFSKKPFLKGACETSEVTLTRKEKESPRPAYHFRVEFEEQTTGPVLLGAHRYFGMGFFKPTSKR